MALNKNHFDSITEATTQTIESTIEIIEVSGALAPADGRNASYYKVSVDPVSSYSFQTLDGAWWLRSKEYLNQSVDLYSDGIQIGTKYEPDAPLSLQIVNNGTSPTLNRIIFGTDNTGYALAISYNYDGVITDRVRIGDNAYNSNTALQVLGKSLYNGDLIPSQSATYNLGSNTARWNVVYTSDLSLRNEHGDWTIVEGENDLFLYNNKNNKTYKFNITEVDPSTVPVKKI